MEGHGAAGGTQQGPERQARRTDPEDHGDPADQDAPGRRAEEALPEHLRVVPESSVRWEFPTAWLLGTKLLSSLGNIIVSNLYAFDPRDWMNPGAPIDLTDRALPESAQDDEACWIDFLADTGDSARLVYQLAYLLQQDSLEVIGRDGKQLLGRDGKPRRLPRGCALVIGGDIAYPISTRAQLLERIRAPFLWAHDKLVDEKKIAPRRPAIPVVAIPGNHDYYNMLDGYQRQFRATCREIPTGAVCPLPERDPVTDPVLSLHGYARCQEASYFALLLPYDWQLWALDIERGRLDDRQQSYFLNLPPPREPGAGPKRIAVTSKPAISYHARSEYAAEIAHAFERVGLETAFAQGGGLSCASAIQLDLAGDDHIYERYWGTTAASGVEASRERRGNETRQQQVTPACPSYASVVSGLGGAFHHPSQIRFGNQAPVSDWPGMARSAEAVGKRLLQPRKVFQAGGVGVVGGLVALLCLGLIWLAERECSVLHIPFAIPTPNRDMMTSAHNLVVVASIVGSLIGLVAILYNGVRTIGWLTAPVRAGVTTGWWSRLTRRIAYAEPVFWGMRWLGASRRNTWGVLISAPAWLPMTVIVVGVSYALLGCPHFASAADGFAPLYVAIVLLVIAMMALAWFVGGQRYRRADVAGPRRIVAHILLVAFGVLIGALIVWTPYAWMRVFVHGTYGVAGAALLVCGYPVLRAAAVRSGFLRWQTGPRRLFALLVFALVVAWGVGVPIATVPLERLSAPPPQWAFLPMIFFGAYFSCLWLGWYFFLCLQWNAHGNEAGSAARVASFAQFLRIKLTRDGAEVWAIAADAPARRRTGMRRWIPSLSARAPDFDDHPIAARVIDHFTVGRGSAGG